MLDADARSIFGEEFFDALRFVESCIVEYENVVLVLVKFVE